jgi:hypothetical protein
MHQATKDPYALEFLTIAADAHWRLVTAIQLGVQSP